MSEDEIKAVVAFYIALVTQVISHTDPQVGALFSATASLMVALVTTGSRKD